MCYTGVAQSTRAAVKAARRKVVALNLLRGGTYAVCHCASSYQSQKHPSGALQTDTLAQSDTIPLRPVGQQPASQSRVRGQVFAAAVHASIHECMLPAAARQCCLPDT
jgi:DNA gyrase inhibitor GyrI